MKTGTAIVRNISFALLMGIMIASCDKDDDKDVQEDLVGTWSTWASTFKTTVGDTTLSQYAIDSLGLTAEQAQLYVTFFNTNLQQFYDGTITFRSDKTYTSDLGGQTESGTWSLSNDRKKLTLTSSVNNIPFDLEVARLTNDELEVNFTQSASEDLNEDNVPETIVVETNMKMVKI